MKRIDTVFIVHLIDAPVVGSILDHIVIPLIEPCDRGQKRAGNIRKGMKVAPVDDKRRQPDEGAQQDQRR